MLEGHPHLDARDVMQVVQMRFAKAERQFHPGASNNYFFVTVRNAALDAIKAAGRRETAPLPCEWAENHPSCDIAGRVEDKVFIEQVMGTLAQEERQVIGLAAGGYTSHEAARIMGISEPAYKSKLNRLRQTMRAAYAEL